MIILNEDTIKPFGRIRNAHDFIGAKTYVASLPLEEDSFIHVESDEYLESLKAYQEVSNEYYGGLPVRIGYYVGYNKKEFPYKYHKSSTICIAVSNCKLGVMAMNDLDEESSFFNYFFIPKNTIFELFGSVIFTPPHDRMGNEIRFIEMYVGNRKDKFSNNFEWEPDKEAHYLVSQNTWEIRPGSNI